MAKDLGLLAPSYASVYKRISLISPALMTMAQDGTKAYTETYDLIYRREADRPNKILASRPYPVGHSGPVERRANRPALADGHSRRLQPRGSGISSLSGRSFGYSNRFGASPCNLAQGSIAMGRLRRTGRALHRSWKRFYIAAYRRSRRQPQNSVSLFDRRKATWPRQNRKIFRTVSDVLLSRLPGFAPGQRGRSAILSLAELDQQVGRFFCEEYNVAPHGTTKVAPLARWGGDAFLPRMPTRWNSSTCCC